MPTEPLPPFPVVLDLTDDAAYFVLTQALEEYAGSARASARDEAESERPDQFRLNDYTRYANTAEQLLADVDRQLEEAGKAHS